MAQQSAIEWTDATVNFWWGCTKVGPGCDHCYAETWSKRTGGAHWGHGVPRRKIASAAKLIHRLDNDYAAWAADRECGLCGPHAAISRRVFIQSMSDLFDLEVPVEWFAEAWGLIKVCKRIEIQIVTKRISAIEKRLAEIRETEWPQHAGLIITVVNQDEADRDVPRLLALKAKLGIPWVGLSCEPLLGPINVSDFNHKGVVGGHNALVDHGLGKIDWVIVGGESGRDARTMHPDWARSLRDQCAAAGTAFLFKQWGEWAPSTPEEAKGNPRSGWQAIAAHPHVARASELYPEAGAKFVARVGKKAAGRLLDGIEHNEFPQVPA
ncbi:phage Gp37/Gp68 family protein [Bradyrhizobium sp. 188]|uniref:phage Gp37/Gp68 family protein n=1 Tax=Bradyrhizobium sp. 188 TaxID=2782656 RepID=UPI001FF98D04|nr:phage Gp37/Gp68 family protein [Bradyrhizobium sp. 188]MCK1503084.1 phage Gp37/Gp68 family protein [Bradyrhizobium sp. 188]